MKINKFNIHWQIARVKAKQIKNKENKIYQIISFLNKHPNIHNYYRVLNWLKMTALGYGIEDREIFINTINQIQHLKHLYNLPSDIDNDLTKISTEHLRMVYNDLVKRKYNFQYKSTPQDHIEFVNQLEQELKQRTI